MVLLRSLSENVAEMALKNKWITVLDGLLNPKDFSEFRRSEKGKFLVPPPPQLGAPPSYFEGMPIDRQISSPSLSHGLEPSASSIDLWSDLQTGLEPSAPPTHLCVGEESELLFPDGAFGECDYPDSPPAYEEIENDCVLEELNVPLITHFHEDDSTLLTEETAKQALLEHAKKKWIRNTRFAKDLRVTNIEHMSVFWYSLKSLVQTRRTRDHKAPYTHGEPLGDGKHTDTNLWGIAVEQQTLFRDWEEISEIPNTSYLTDCNICSSKGHVNCSKCQGTGKLHCPYCRHPYESYQYRDITPQKCSACCNTGHRKCDACSGKGNKRCTACDGSGKVRHCRQLVVEWRVLEDEGPACDVLDVPFEMKSKLQAIDGHGKEVFSREGTYVSPIVNSTIDRLDAMSERLLRRHSDKSQDSMVVKQKHSVKKIHLARVTGESKRSYTYFVYGINRVVYAPKYPRGMFL